eukprot:9448310-Pyramimonas_sp.AAC.1
MRPEPIRTAAVDFGHLVLLWADGPVLRTARNPYEKSWDSRAPHIEPRWRSGQGTSELWITETEASE